MNASKSKTESGWPIALDPSSRQQIPVEENPPGAPLNLSDQLGPCEETTRVLLNASADSALLTNAQGVVLAANQNAIQQFEKTSGEVVGRPLNDFLPTQLAAARDQKRLEAIRTGRELRFDEEWRGRAYRTAIHPIRSESGHIGKLAIFSRDITEELRSEEHRKQLARQLQQAQKMEAIGTLAGGIAHDFNNLLMAIQGNVSLALFDMEPSQPQHRILANIEKLVRSGADLTSKLLGYARKGKYEMRLMRLNDLVRETSETFGRMRKDITIARHFTEDLKSIVADKGQMEQVLLNLFVNAADAMPKGGKLTLTTRNVTHQDIPYRGYTIKPGNYVLLTVEDTGVGMEKDVITRIFDPFFTTKKMGSGTGLGLASAYGIVKGHNGYIDVASEKNKGSVFYIYLPASEQPSLERSALIRKAERGSGTILLVEDEPSVMEITARMIERLGYTVIRARSGCEAIERYRENAAIVSVVILDMIMPEMSGGEVFEELKRVDPSVKVLLATGYSMQGQAREIMNRGCIGFIQKPFSMEDLSVKLNSILPPTLAGIEAGY
jgi:PAS domain S-box-containing protein